MRGPDRVLGFIPRHPIGLKPLIDRRQFPTRGPDTPGETVEPVGLSL
jgi:hypothetical protein